MVYCNYTFLLGKDNTLMISIIVPVFNEEETIPLFYQRITNELVNNNNIDGNYELIFVNDGSSDNTWSIIQKLISANIKVHGIKFSRNFGKEAAIFAGLHKAQGNCAIIMDCDLQHPPELIAEMYKYYFDGYKIVRCIKKQRNKESLLRKICNSLFFRFFNTFDSTQINITNVSDFQLIDRKVIDYILKFQETALFFRGISSYVGFKTIDIEFNVPERISGDSKWNYKTLIKYAFSNMSTFSSKPLQLVTFNGFILLIVASLLTIRTMYVFFINAAAPGITTVIILLLFIGSLLMISLGIIGFYIGKIYDEVKHRPRYIIEEEL